MGRKVNYILFIYFLFVFSSCTSVLMEDEFESTPTNNFKVLSKVIKEKYSYLKYKNINWDSIVSANSIKINDKLGPLQEFNIYAEMLYQLKDGHVNLSAGFDVSRNWSWYLNTDTNFEKNVVERNYLADDYYISGGLKHKILVDGINKFGYVYYSSFSSSVDYVEFVKVYMDHENVEGIIIDVRDNGGGYLQYAIDLASAFADKKRLGYVEYYKSGPGEDEFDGPYENYFEPKGFKWSKPIIILTNRKCYSATSFFVTMMKELPNVTVIGDKTGGGAGLPADYYLPNGWHFRFSASRCQSPSGEEFELGVDPDIKVDLDKTKLLFGIDSYIELAKSTILSN